MAKGMVINMTITTRIQMMRRRKTMMITTVSHDRKKLIIVEAHLEQMAKVILQLDYRQKIGSTKRTRS